MTPVLELRDLSVRLVIEGALRPVLSGVSLAIGPAEIVGLVGESGSGKSMTARAVARLLPPGAEADGRVLFDGEDVVRMAPGRLRWLRTQGLSMVFQDPRAHVNPVRRIGDFLTESLRTNLGVEADAARRRAVELLADVGLADGERRLRQYPHELSGGMLQRVMIASALACEPRLLLADEPTTALDVTIQADIMAILRSLQRERALAILFITHDLELAAAMCDRICVMYAGSLVEEQGAASLFRRPLHPYTAALLDSRPRAGASAARLSAIPGRPVSAFEAPPGCAFSPRCPHAQPRCIERRPGLVSTGGGERVACARSAELRGRLRDAPSEVAHE